MKCAGFLTDGTTPCKMSAFGDARLCAQCGARAGLPEHRAEMIRRSELGREAKIANAILEKRTVCSLRSTNDLLAECEHAMVDLESASGDVTSRVKARISVISEARAILKSEVVEKENSELKALIGEHLPHLRKHLRSA
jgi:hypothetical protein